MGEALSSCTDPKDRGEIDVENMKEVEKQHSKAALSIDSDQSESTLQSRN